MSFVIRMALREVRASWQRLLFFFICIAVGVAAIVAIRSVIHTVRGALTSESRALTGGDMIVTSNNPFSDHVRQVIEGEQRAGRISTASNAVEVATMARPGDTSHVATKMVELRAVQ